MCPLQRYKKKYEIPVYVLLKYKLVDSTSKCNYVCKFKKNVSLGVLPPPTFFLLMHHRNCVLLFFGESYYILMDGFINYLRKVFYVSFFYVLSSCVLFLVQFACSFCRIARYTSSLTNKYFLIELMCNVLQECIAHVSVSLKL